MDLSEYLLAALLIVCVGLFVCGMGYAIIGDLTMVSQSTETQIYSLKDSTGIHGSFMLGSGVVDSYPSYISYEREEDGAYKIFTANAGISKLYMDNPLHPYIKSHFQCSSVFPARCKPTHLYEFHVPNGTIVQEFRTG